VWAAELAAITQFAAARARFAAAADFRLVARNVGATVPRRIRLCCVQPSLPVGQILSAVVARLDTGEAPQSGICGIGDWVVMLTSLLALLAAGGVAARVARRLMRRSAPELTVLLNQSAAFYGRWPEDRLASAPDGELLTETARCRRIIELLDSRRAAAVDGGSATRGAIAGLRAWTTLLYERLEDHLDAPSRTPVMTTGQ
jgi:hypothetical protein